MATPVDDSLPSDLVGEDDLPADLVGEGDLPADLEPEGPRSASSRPSVQDLAPEELAPLTPTPAPKLGFMDKLRNVDTALKTTAQGFGFDTGVQTPAAVIRNLDAAKTAFVDPTVEAFQTHIGRPLVEGQFALEKKLGIPEVPAVEMLRRSAVQFLAGPGVLEGMDDKKKAKAIDDVQRVFASPMGKALGHMVMGPGVALLDKFGPSSIQEYLPNTPEKQTAYTLGLAQQVGEMPLMFVGGGKAMDMARKSSGAARAVGYGLAGAEGNALVSFVTPGSKLSQEAAIGFAMGGAPAGVAELAPKVKVLGVGMGKWLDEAVADLMHPLGKDPLGEARGKMLTHADPTLAEKKLIEHRAKEQAGVSSAARRVETAAKREVIQQNIVDKVVKRGLQEEAARSPTGPAFIEAKLKDPTFKPGTSIVAKAPDGDGYIARLIQVLPDQRRVYEKRIKTPGEAAEFYQHRVSKGAPEPVFDTALTGDSGFTKLIRPLTDPKRAPVKVPPKPTTGEATVPNQRLQGTPLDLDELPPGVPTDPRAIVLTEQGLRLENFDSPEAKAHALGAAGVEMVQTPEGPKVGFFFGDTLLEVPGMPPEFSVKEIAHRTGAVPPTHEELVSMLSGITPPPRKPVKGALPLQDAKASQLLETNPNPGRIKAQETPTQAAGAAPPMQPPKPPARPPDEPPRYPPPGPGELPQSQLNVMKNINGMVQGELKQPGIFDKVMRQMVGSHVRGPLDLAQLAAIQKSIKHLEASGIDTNKALQRAFGRHLTSELDADLLKLAKTPTEELRAKFSDEMAAKKYGPVWEAHKQKVFNALRERDLLDQKIAALGGIPEELSQLRTQGQLDAYVARDFMAYTLPPGEWAKLAKRDKDLMNRGIAWLREQSGPGLSDADLEAKLNKILQDKDPLGELSNPVYGIKSAQHLKKKEDLPQVLRDLLGENRSGALAIGNSLGAQRAIASNLAMWREVARNPKYALPTLTDAHKGQGWQQLPNNKRAFGDAANLYVHPTVYDTLVTLPNSISNGFHFLNTLMGVLKSNEVVLGGAGPWLNAVMGNISYSIKAGGLDPLGSPMRSGRALKEAVKTMRAYHKDPSSPEAHNLMEARRVGVDAPGHYAVDVDPVNKRLIDNMMEAYERDGQSHLDWVQRTGEALKKAANPKRFLDTRNSPVSRTLGTGFDQIDRTYKVASWLALVEKFKADPAKYLPGATDIDEAAKRLAAYRVNRSFPAPDKLAPAVDKIKKMGAGVFAKYWTYSAEALRITGDIPAHIAEEPELAWRLFKYGVAAAAIAGAGGAARRNSGIPDEEVEAAMALQTDQQKRHKAAVFALPWRDAKGRPQLWDITSWVPESKYFHTHPDRGMFENALMVTGENLLGGGMGEDVLHSMAAQAGGAMPPQQFPLRPGEGGVLNGLQHAWGTLGLGPKAITREYDILRRGQVIPGDLPSTQEGFTPGQVVGQTFGFKVEPYGVSYDAPGYKRALLSHIGKINSLKKQIPSIANMPDNQADKMLLQMGKLFQSNPSSIKDERFKALWPEIAKALADLQELNGKMAAAMEAKKRMK